jgi:hypothetical protein
MSQTPSRDRIGARPSGQRTVSRPIVMNLLRTYPARIESFSRYCAFPRGRSAGPVEA